MGGFGLHPSSEPSVGTVTRDSAGLISAFGSTIVRTRDRAGRVTSYSDAGVTYTVTYGAQGVEEVAAA